MSTVTPSLIPRAPAFPLLLPEVPKPHPTPLPPNSDQTLGRLNSRRNLRNEYDDLSDDEEEVEGQWKEGIQMRGYNSLHVIGRLKTKQEEKNDAETESDESGSAHPSEQVSNGNDGENGSEQDLDANMEDLDDMDGQNEQFSSDDGDEDLDDSEDELEL